MYYVVIDCFLNSWLVFVHGTMGFRLRGLIMDVFIPEEHELSLFL